MDITKCRSKLRDEFLKNKNVTDIRVTDMLVIKVFPLNHCLLDGNLI